MKKKYLKERNARRYIQIKHSTNCSTILHPAHRPNAKIYQTGGGNPLDPLPRALISHHFICWTVLIKCANSMSQGVYELFLLFVKIAHMIQSPMVQRVSTTRKEVEVFCKKCWRRECRSFAFTVTLTLKAFWAMTKNRMNHKGPGKHTSLNILYLKKFEG